MATLGAGPAFDSICTRLRRWAATRPAATALIVVSEAGEQVWSYAQLDQRAHALAVHLQARHAPGDRVLLLLDNDAHYVAAFFGCLYAGLVAVPAFPPETVRERHLGRLQAIAADAQAACVLCTAAARDGLSGQAAFAGVPVIAVDALEGGLEEAALARVLPPPAVAADQLAFLQYTSGSTAAPKGVMVSHGNIMANEEAIAARFGVTARDVFASWLPLYHDMGLIGGLLQPLHAGITAVLMSPNYFLERPVRWLQAISRHGATISGGPDFAYRLCLERVRASQHAGLDLSRWRIAFCGAEPVRQATLQAFAERFAENGFAASALYPCYGLAEATLMVTGGESGAGMTARVFSADALERGDAEPAHEAKENDSPALVACGAVAPLHRLRIADPATGAVLPDGRVGEIQAAGPSIAQGYWRRPKETRESFLEAGGERWLRTGDLGFVHEGQVYVAGRHKDLIIVRGRNLYPQDIEQAVEAEVAAARKGRVAVFAVETHGAEGIGIAVEISRAAQKAQEPSRVVEALGRAVGLACGEALSVAVLLNPGGLPKTSSGKLQRQACRRAWQGSELDAYAVWADGRFLCGASRSAPAEGLQDAFETRLAAMWEEVLGRPVRERQASFFALGGNSLAAAQLAARMRAEWGLAVAPRFAFDHPVLSEAAAALRLRHAKGESVPQQGITPLPAGDRSGPLALSHAQQRQWFLWKLDPLSAAYHIGGGLTLRGALDALALEAALRALVTRHDSLRTVYRADAQGVAQQWVLPAMDVPLARIDVTDRPAAQREAAVQAAARTVVDTPFDLQAGPLLRAALIRQAAAEHVLVLAVHHIAADGRSMQLLIDELGALLQGQAPGTLPVLPIRYADYAAWQRAWLEQGEGARQLAYWRHELGGEPAVLEWPAPAPSAAAEPRTNADKPAGTHRFELSRQLLDDLRTRSESDGYSLFMFLLASLQAVLHRHTQQDTVRVGVPVANRQRLETEGVVGFFVNTLVLSGRFAGRPRLQELLAATREAVLVAQAHQDVPFEQLVQAVQPAPGAERHPLFQVLFNLRRQDLRRLQYAGLAATPYPLEDSAARFDLSLDVVEDGSGALHASFVYATACFDAATVDRLARQLIGVLTCLRDAPQTPVDALDLLSPAEHAAWRRWAEGAAAATGLVPVHRLVERQAARQPQASAALCGTERLDYGSLNRRANRLARRLQAAGAGQGAVVAIAAERSLHTLVAMLAVVKAGAAYLPLDPNLPAARLAELLADARPAALLGSAAHRGSLQAPGIPVLILEQDGADPGVGHADGVDVNTDVHPDQLAYVLYTSGSTGRPKAVAMRHGALAQLLAWQAVRLPAAARALQFAAFGFDVSFQEIFGTWAEGGTVVMASPAERLDMHALLRLARAQAVERVYLPFAVLQQFAQTALAAGLSLPALRQAVTAGEALRMTPALAGWLAREPRCRLFNQYGPTETHVVTDFEATGAPADTLPPIGRPVDGACLRVLDAGLRPVAPGLPGELYIGGAALARGYLHRPALTAERFVPDPFGEPGARLYRSGDRVRWRPNGQLEYLGRLDQQVKIRGHRVEPAEVEACLQAVPGVHQAAVVARAAPAGLQLAAYVEPQPDNAVTIDALRAALAQRLPEYMLPTAWMLVDRMPVNAHGKVDRKALPPPQWAAPRSFEAPGNPTELALATIWAEVLGAPRVGRHDDFFELGGHSLAAVQIAAVFTQRHGCELAVRHFFDHPTLAGLAATLPAEASLDGSARAARLARMDQLLNEFEI